MINNKKSLRSRTPQAYSRKSRETSSNNDYSRKIFVGKKPVGEVFGDEFFKKLHSSIHFLKVPPAIAFDIATIPQAQKLGATRVKIYDQDTDLVYRASIELIITKGFEFNRGYGDQIGLELIYLDCQGAKNKGRPSPKSPKVLNNINTNNNSSFTNSGAQPYLFN